MNFRNNTCTLISKSGKFKTQKFNFLNLSPNQDNFDPQKIPGTSYFVRILINQRK